MRDSYFYLFVILIYFKLLIRCNELMNETVRNLLERVRSVEHSISLSGGRLLDCIFVAVIPTPVQSTVVDTILILFSVNKKNAPKVD